MTFAALFPEATPAVMICALAGAALYVLSSGQHRFWKQVIFALISFVGGVYCAETASAIITGILNAVLSHLNPPVTVKVSRHWCTGCISNQRYITVADHVTNSFMEIR